MTSPFPEIVLNVSSVPVLRVPPMMVMFFVFEAPTAVLPLLPGVAVIVLSSMMILPVA